MWDWLQHNWKMFVDLVVFIAVLAFFALRKTYAKREDLDELEKEVVALKQAVKSLPDKELVHSLALEVERLRGDIKAIEPSLATVKNLADMLLENELKGRQK